MDRRAWWATVYGITGLDRLNDWAHTSMHRVPVNGKGRSSLPGYWKSSPFSLSLWGPWPNSRQGVSCKSATGGKQCGHHCRPEWQGFLMLSPKRITWDETKKCWCLRSIPEQLNQGVRKGNPGIWILEKGWKPLSYPSHYSNNSSEWPLHTRLSNRNMCVCVYSVVTVVSDSLQPHGWQPTRLLCPWDFPGQHTRVGCHSLLLGIFPTQGLNPSLLCLLHCR